MLALDFLSLGFLGWSWRLTIGPKEAQEVCSTSSTQKSLPRSAVVQRIKTSITYRSPNVSPGSRIVTCYVDEFIIAHDISCGCNMTNVCQPKGDHIVSDYLRLCGAIEDCNADHGEQEIDISQPAILLKLEQSLQKTCQDLIKYSCVHNRASWWDLRERNKKSSLLQGQHASVVGNSFHGRAGDLLSSEILRSDERYSKSSDPITHIRGDIQ